LTDSSPKRSLKWYRQLCDNSFFHFVRICGGYAGQGGIVTESIHHPLCKFFQNPLEKRKCFFMPRNWLKSTTFTEWGAIWLYLQNPDIRILLASQNEKLAKRFKRFIESQILYNTRLRQLYPDRLTEVTPEYRYRRGNVWTSEEMYLPRATRYRGGKEATIQSIGVGGAAQSGHFDWIIIDDPVGKKHMESLPELEKVLNWQDNVKELCDNPNYENPDSSVVQIVCTFWGPGDYGSYVMTEYPEYKFKIVPALKYEGLKNTENVEWIQDPNAEYDCSNWEHAPNGKSTTEYYHNMRAHPQQQVIFWSQHMNMPQKAGGLHKFDVSWLRPFVYEDRENDQTGEKEKWVVCEDDGKEFLYADIPKYGGVDPGGFSDTKSARTSRLGMLIAGKPPDSLKKFAFWAWAGRLKEPSRFVADLFQTHEKYMPMKWYVETEGQQPYIYRHIRECRTKGVEWEGKKYYARGMIVDHFPYDRQADAKDMAITDLIPSVENGEWYVHKNLCQALIAEMQNYPHGMTKDLLDLMGKLYKLRLQSHRPKNWQELMLQKSKETASRRGEMGY